MNISQQKQWRRQRLNELYEELGPKALHDATGIAEAYLFQMAQGEGRQKRGVSDESVEKIEAGTRRIGWFDLPKPETPTDNRVPQILSANAAPVGRKRQRAGGWIGEDITPAQRELVRAVEMMASVIPDARAKAIAELILLSGGPVESPPKINA